MASNKISAERRAEIDNALEAAADLARDAKTERRCLTCGGELVVKEAGASYQVICVTEQRVLLTSRGI
jgi:hypothetical protein